MEAGHRLSVVMPVDNLERDISLRVERLMELLSDLTEQFEVVAVDDASTDATAEVLDDLRRRLPQLRVKRLNDCVGPTAAAAEGLPLAQGDFIFLHESYAAVDSDAIRQLWQMRSDRDLVLARVEFFQSEIDADMVGRLDHFAAKLQPKDMLRASSPQPQRKPTGQLQMLRRDAIAESIVNRDHLSLQRRVRSEIQPPVESAKAGRYASSNGPLR